eukprot:scaffold192424_cov33-Tisochrysis_lutea.AAC.5
MVSCPASPPRVRQYLPGSTPNSMKSVPWPIVQVDLGEVLAAHVQDVCAFSSCQGGAQCGKRGAGRVQNRCASASSSGRNRRALGGPRLMAPIYGAQM